MHQFASRNEFSTLGSDFTVASGDPIKVYGIVIMNTGASNNVNVEFQTAESTPVVFATHQLDQSKLIIQNIPFIADKGLIVSSGDDADINTTIWYSTV